MGFVSLRGKKQYDQSAVFQEEYQADPTFYETFGAGVGMAIDEGLSISSTLNRQGFTDRKLLAEKMIDEGKIEKGKYFIQTRRGSKFDWDNLANDVEEIKSDTELNEERNKMLSDRREFGQDIIERGSGVAGFLGSASGYLLDPISIATMPIGYSTAGLKGLAAVSRAASRVGMTELATETAIQGFVLNHKQDIDAPYDWKDAITAMSTAALGGSLFGAVGAGAKELLSSTKFGKSEIANTDVGGILEYIKGVRKKTSDLPQDPSLGIADETLARLEETLTNNPLRKTVTAEPVDIEAEKIKFLDDLKSEIPDAPLDKNTKAVLASIEKGEVPSAYKKQWDTLQQDIKVKQARGLKKALIKADADYLEGLEVRRTQRQPRAEIDQPPVEKVKTAGAISERERMALDKVEETENYAQDMAKYKERFKDNNLSDVTIKIDDVVVNPKEFIGDLDAEIDGLDSITMCLSK